MSGRIVVGVDGSEDSAVALCWALEEARLRHASLDVVHAWHYPYAAYTEITGMAAGVISREDLEQLGREVLQGAMEEAGAESAGVDVKTVLAHGGAAGAMLEAADGADLLVVGSRGRGGFVGLLLGSVSQQCAHHARCPVVIVSTPSHPEP